ncbi:28S ribosomal S10-like protein, partial [Dinothrombium tinctorium]
VNEPEYLDYLKPQIPYYELLNIKVKGYDFAVLDEYAKYVRKCCKRLRIEVNSWWAVPHQTLKAEKLRPRATVVDDTYHLNIYERVVQIKHLKAKTAPILIEVLQASKPTGVTFNIAEHTTEDTEIRYIPDLRLAELKAELEEWQQPLTVLQQQHRKL